MREILFRGKRMDDGEWVEGYLVKAVGGECMILPVTTEHCGGAEFSEGYHCDPTTVGQYTGLKDKNGKRIFEGDIVHCLARMDEANCVVIFEEGEFRLVPERTYKTYVTGGGYHALRCFVKEVIGNIHGNQELQKGGEG